MQCNKDLDSEKIKTKIIVQMCSYGMYEYFCRTEGSHEREIVQKKKVREGEGDKRKRFIKERGI